MFLRKVSLTIFSTSRMRCFTCTSMRAPSTPRAKDNTCRTMSAPRRALELMIESSSRLSGSVNFISSSSSEVITGASTLFRSCAMPPASVPMLSIRWARRNCCSICLRSVMSLLIARIDFGVPVSSRISVQLTSTTRMRPSFVRFSTSPSQYPFAMTFSRASAIFSGLA